MLVPRYVAGDLSRSERAEFEAWLIASPELAAEVEMERRLRRGMASAARRGWLKRRSTGYTGNHQRWPLAIAASAIVALALAFLLNTSRIDSPGDLVRLGAGGASRAELLTVRLTRVRGSGDAPDIRFSKSDVPASLTIEPDVVVLTCADGAVELECTGGGPPQVPQYAEYEVDLVNRRTSTLAWRSSRQAPAMRTELSFTLRDPSVLNAGDYDVIVRGVSTDHEEIVGRFWLQVER